MVGVMVALLIAQEILGPSILVAVLEVGEVRLSLQLLAQTAVQA
jgi:hypothetical protein